jgi:hypothetical protein
MSGTLYAKLYFAALVILFIVASIIGVAQLWQFYAAMVNRYGGYMMGGFGDGRNQKGA